jgi:hypothetical protein
LFPLRTSWIPSYVTIDSKILCQNILGRSWTNYYQGNKMALWDQVVNLHSRPFRHQEGGGLCFRGTIQTDGVGVTILKKRRDTQARYGARFAVQVENTRYINELTPGQHQEIAGECVTIDPGRRDMLFCMHEDSTAQHPIKYRYTKPCQDKHRKTKDYRRILRQVKPQAVADAERTLVNSRSLTVQGFEQFLHNRSLVTDLLTNHYGETATEDDTAPLHRKLKLSAYIRKQIADQDFIANLRDHFGENAVLVMGNWSAPHVRYQEPIRGVGFRRLLKKNGFRVYLIDEFRTSRCCPACEHTSLETFKQVPNPRPYRQQANPRVIRHGLLRY